MPTGRKSRCMLVARIHERLTSNIKAPVRRDRKIIPLLKELQTLLNLGKVISPDFSLKFYKMHTIPLSQSSVEDTDVAIRSEKKRHH